MGVRPFWSPRRRTTASATTLVLVVGVLVAFAYSSVGFPVAQVELNDGSVWVTNLDRGYVGRFNRPIEQLDVRISPTKDVSADFEVLQEGGTVFVHDINAGSLRQIDAATTDVSGDTVDLPKDSQVGLGGSTVAVFDPGSGKVWARSVEDVLTLVTAKDPPSTTVGVDARLVVGVDGTVQLVSATDDRLVTIALGAGRVSPEIHHRQLGLHSAKEQVTAVGADAVVLGDGGRLRLPSGQIVTLPAGSAEPQLQLPGAAADAVLVATATALLSVSLSDGAIAVLSDRGTGGAIAPVWLNGCAHAAWVGSSGGKPRYLRHCVGAVASSVIDLPTTGGGPMTFRVNRDTVVLNSVRGGEVYLFDRGANNLGNWAALEPPVASRDPNNADPRKPDKSDANHPPVAKPDFYGVRPAQASRLNVLDNDSDPDEGDILVISQVSAVPAELGRIAIVANGQALQFVAAAGATGKVAFRYTISDGHGASAATKVEITIRVSGNTLPVPLPRGSKVSVAPGGTVSYNVLRDWRDDADGDPLILTDATTSGSGDTVRFSPDGEVTFVDGGKAGHKRVTVKVSDGVGEPVSGSLTVDTDTRPVARDDLAVAVAGRTVTVRPLDNDSDPNAGLPGTTRGLRLTHVSVTSGTTSGATLVQDYVAGTVGFTATRVGTYYLGYQVVDGTVATGRIRIDVRPASSTNPPVAVADRAVLHGTTTTTVDVLANDTDLDGDVLAVQSVSVPDGTGLVVSVVDQRWLTIAASQASLGTTAIHYTVSDGSNSDDSGIVEVTRLPEITDDRPPTPRDDAISVRAGDVTVIDVLANDTDPEGESLTLANAVVPAKQNAGLWLVGARTVRYQAPEKAGTATATYTVRDPEGKSAVAQIVVTVIARNPDVNNQRPQPPTVEARAFAGATVRIAIPLTGIDPDGDSTILLGPAQSPRLGRVVNQGLDFLEYQAYAGSAGTDEFTYRLVDSLGARGTGQIRLAVVPPAARDSAPVAVDDAFTVAPGASISVPVLANDSDADADPLSVEPLSTVNPRLPAGVALVGNRVVVTSDSHDGGTVMVRYSISDGRGQRGTATVTITSSKGANNAPIARDDLAQGVKAGDDHVDVHVLDNDEDLDGPSADLRLAAVNGGPGRRVEVVDGGILRIGLTTEPAMVAYQITDAHGATATAFVQVPAAGNQPPVRRLDAPPVELTSGANLAVDLSTQVSDPEGAPVRLTTVAAMSSSPTPGLTVVSGSEKPGGFTLRAAGDFSGLASVVFEVTDGASLNDPAGHVALISLPVSVTPVGGGAPRFSCPPVELQAGAPPVSVNLASCVARVARDSRVGLIFTGLTGGPTGVTTRLTGTVLRLSAGADAATGKPAQLSFTVTDAHGRSAPATLALVVRPAELARAVTDTVVLEAGQKVDVAVTANDVNPFPDQPLQVDSVSLKADGGSDTTLVSASVAADKTQVTIASGAGKHGTATLSYWVLDGTRLPDRKVLGQIVVHVADRPSAPQAPTVRAVGDGTVELAWVEPENNGAPITGYKILDQSNAETDCTLTVCQLTRLTNGTTYRFRVLALNRVGRSEASPASADVVPGGKPDQPDPPTTQFGDGAITVRWLPPNSPGTAIASYSLEISPPVGAGGKNVTGTSYTWRGLTNGVAYTFRVQAVNRANKASDWSGYSTPEIPAGPPRTPDAPTATGVANGIGKQIAVAWTAPADNGATISGYQLTVIRAGTVDHTQTVAGDVTQATVDVANGVDYSFQVTATNKAGSSSPSAPSAAAVAHGAPSQVASFAVSDSSGAVGLDRRISYAVTPPYDNGMAISRYEFSYTGGSGVDSTASSANGYLTGLTNGSTYQVSVRACNDVCGQWSAQSAAVTPYGPPVAPGVSASNTGGISVHLTWGPQGTNGRPISRIEISVNGAAWQGVGAGAGTRNVGNGPNQTFTLRARTIDTANQISVLASASASTSAASVVLTEGALSGAQPGCPSGCHWIITELINFPAGASVTCQFTSNIPPPTFQPHTHVVDANGHWKGQFYNYFGDPNGWVQATCNGVASPRLPWH